VGWWRPNDEDQIVGAFSQSPDGPLAGTAQAFLLDEGRFSTFAVPDALTTVAYGVNNHGDVVGQYVGADGGLHGFGVTL
jgi:hypothetical protein